jgi:hypothetical protein
MVRTYLIELVKDMPPLWDQKDKKYNRDIRPKLWGEIGDASTVFFMFLSFSNKLSQSSSDPCITVSKQTERRKYFCW